MTIEPIVRDTAAHFGVDPALIQAVIAAEGNILKAVQCSIPSIDTREKALEVTCRSANHAQSAYVSTHDAAGFVAFWASIWAPTGAKNDPHDLNRNWPLNVLRMWKKTL